jgi:hypothetical protein
MDVAGLGGYSPQKINGRAKSGQERVKDLVPGCAYEALEVLAVGTKKNTTSDNMHAYRAWIGKN